MKNKEAGSTMIELGIALPLLFAMIAGLIDLACALNQYLILSSSVYDGLRFATTVSGLEDGTPYNGPTGNINCSSLNFSSRHEEVQKRIQSSLTQEAWRLDLATLCVESQVTQADGTDQANTIRIRVSVRYQGYLPGISGMTLSSESFGPYLSEGLAVQCC
jgi:Flp pilus assembly protein TadG